VDTRVVVWIREFLLGRTHRVSVGGQLWEKDRVTSGVKKGSAFTPLFLLAYVHDIWKIIESTIRIFADDSIISRKILSNNYMKRLQTYLNRLRKWAIENEIIINLDGEKSLEGTSLYKAYF
jgi:hypothetical protein